MEVGLHCLVVGRWGRGLVGSSESRWSYCMPSQEDPRKVLPDPRGVPHIVHPPSGCVVMGVVIRLHRRE